MKRIIKIGMICLTVSVFPGTALRAASDLTIGDILKWIDKHRTELTAEWHLTDGPTKWQPDAFKDFSGTQDYYWDRTIKWDVTSECPRFARGLEKDGVTYSITRALSSVGEVSDISDQEATKDRSHTARVASSYTWRIKLSQVAPDPVVMDYKEYMQRINHADKRTVDAGTYYYVCILPKPDADPNAMIETDAQTTDDGEGHVTADNDLVTPSKIASIAAVRDRQMADRLATAMGHLIKLLQKAKQPKEAF